MTKPNDIEQWAWDRAGKLVSFYTIQVTWTTLMPVKGNEVMRKYIAIALMAVKAEQREEDAKIAEMSPFGGRGGKSTSSWVRKVKAEIAIAIRKGRKTNDQTS